MIKLTDYLNQLGLENKDFSELLSIAQPFEIPEGGLLFKKGQISNRAYFIEDGIIAEFSDLPTETETETETVNWLLGSGDWAYSIDSYITETPAQSNLRALTLTRGYFFEKRAMERLLTRKPHLDFAAYKLSETYILKLENRNKLHRTKAGKERLELFERQQPLIAQRIKQKYIAAYLNLTPTQLSRIRHDRQKT